MDERKASGTWVEPKYDPEQLQYPPATGAPDAAAPSDLEPGTTAMPRTDGVSLTPTGPMIADEGRMVQADVQGDTTPRASGIGPHRSRELDGDPSRPD